MNAGAQRQLAPATQARTFPTLLRRIESNSGFFQMPFGVWREIRRLGGSNGTVKDLLELVYACCYLRRRSSREDLPEWTEDLKIEEIAEVLGVCPRNVEYAIQYVVARKIAEIRRQGVQRCSLRLKLDTWAKLPDYEPLDPERSRPADAEVADERKPVRITPASGLVVAAGSQAEPIDPERSRPADAEVADERKPVRITPASGLVVAAGSQAEPIAVPAAHFARVRSVVVASADREHNAVLGMLIIGGELRVTLSTQESGLKNGRPSEINELISKSRNALQDEGAEAQRGEQVAEHQRITERAAKSDRLKSFKQIQREEEDEQLEKYMRMRRGQE